MAHLSSFVFDPVLESSACAAELGGSVKYPLSSSGGMQFCLLPCLFVPGTRINRESGTPEVDDVGGSWTMRLLHLHCGTLVPS
jgi:hypothetical protein